MPKLHHILFSISTLIVGTLIASSNGWVWFLIPTVIAALVVLFHEDCIKWSILRRKS